MFLRITLGFVLASVLAMSPWRASLRGEVQTATASRSDPNRDRLASLVGDWSVEVTYIIAGRENRSSAQMHAEWVLDKHFIRQEYASKMGPSTFLTLQFLGYDPIRKKFTILKMDNLDDAMLYADGDLEQGGRTLTFVGMRSDMMTRTTGKLRQLLTFVDADHFTLDWYLTGSDGTEIKTVTMSHTRSTAPK